MSHSNRRPDEEGIKTSDTIPAPEAGIIPTADLMKKGLRLCGDVHQVFVRYSNRRPDEEGIKTRPPALPTGHSEIPTADLIKKGLRRH